MSEQEHTSVERLVRKSLIDEDALGRPVNERVRQSRRTLENYLKAGGIPRWMERVMEVDRRIAQQPTSHHHLGITVDDLEPV